MRKLIPFLLSLSPFVLNAQDGSAKNDLINEQFDKLILGDQKRKVTIATSIPPDAAIFQCNDTFPAYDPKMDLVNGRFNSMLGNPRYTEASKIQFIKNVLADTTEEGEEHVNYFIHSPGNFWRSSKKATALINAWFDKQLEKSGGSDEFEKLSVGYKRLEFVTRSQCPESYQMITDYIKNRPDVTYKYGYEDDLVYWLVQMGKEKEGLDFLELIIEDLIHDRIKAPSYLNDGYGVLERANIFEFLCLSENEAVAKRATDLLFHLLNNKNLLPYFLYPLSSCLDKQRHDQMMDKWFTFYSSLDFSKVDPKELQTNGWEAVKKSVPECDAYVSFMLYDNWEYLHKRYGKKYYEELLSTSAYTQKRRDGRTFEAVQLEHLDILFTNHPYSNNDLQQMLLQAVKTDSLFKPEYKERYLKLVSLAWPDGNVPKADFDKLQLGKLLTWSAPLKLKLYKKDITPAVTMPEEKINELIADLNSVAVTCNLPEFRPHKLTKFLLSRDRPYNVFNYFLHVNKLIVSFHRYVDAPEDAHPVPPINYVDLFINKFSQAVVAQHCDHFTIGQATKSLDNNEYNYNLFVKYNKSGYNLTYTEKPIGYYSDVQRLVKMLNLCLIDNKEKKRFIGMYGEMTRAFILMEPAAVMALSKKYNLGLYVIDENEGAPKR